MTEIMLRKPDVNQVLTVASQTQNRLFDYRNYIAIDYFYKKHPAPNAGDAHGFDHAAEMAYWVENFTVSDKLVDIEQAIKYVIGIRSGIDHRARQQYEDMRAALDLIGKARAFLNSRPSYPSLVTYDDMYIKSWDEADGDSKINAGVDEGGRHGC